MCSSGRNLGLVKHFVFLNLPEKWGMGNAFLGNGQTSTRKNRLQIKYKKIPKEGHQQFESRRMSPNALEVFVDGLLMLIQARRGYPSAVHPAACFNPVSSLQKTLCLPHCPNPFLPAQEMSPGSIERWRRSLWIKIYQMKLILIFLGHKETIIQNGGGNHHILWHWQG